MAKSQLRHTGHHDFPARIKPKCDSVLAALERQAMEMGSRVRAEFQLSSQGLPELLSLPRGQFPSSVGGHINRSSILLPKSTSFFPKSIIRAQG